MIIKKSNITHVEFLKYIHNDAISFREEAFRKPMNFIRGMNECSEKYIDIDKTLD